MMELPFAAQFVIGFDEVVEEIIKILRIDDAATLYLYKDARQGGSKPQ